MSNYPLITLDFEASSLSETGYPIEVAVVIGDHDGIQAQFSTLIAPRPELRGKANWSEASQAVHGIEFEWLGEGPIHVKWWPRPPAEEDSQHYNGARVGRLETTASLHLIAASGMLDWLFRPYAHRPPNKKLLAFRQAINTSQSTSTSERVSHTDIPYPPLKLKPSWVWPLFDR